MEMAVRSMETAETAMETNGDGFYPPKFVGGGGATELFLEILPTPLGFSVPRLYIGEGASSGGCQGTLTHRGRGLPLGDAALVCGALMAPLCLLFGSLEASVKFWATDFGFVQFREYFLCNFSETQKQQKTENWHCGILSIG
jgi:hypothetical protein